MNKPDSIYTAVTGKTIGVSISQSEDLDKLGFGKAHLEDAKIEIARHLLSCGATLMYGGDLSPDGFTIKLIELVENYKIKSLPIDQEALINMVGWPLQLDLTDDFRASVSGRIVFEETGLPSDLPNNLSAKNHLLPKNTEQFYNWTRTMSYMRDIMTKKNDARIVLGGKTTDYKGKYPGIVEESYLSIKAGRPTFLLGAFGGATADVIEAINGKSPFRLTPEYQFQNQQTRETAFYYNENKPNGQLPINFEDLVDFFNSKGIGALNNGLTDLENKRLFETIHIPEMISLVLKGLVGIFDRN
jgi:hypothetical protein